MDPLNPFIFPAGPLAPALSPEQREIIEELQKVEKGILEWGKKNLSPSEYAAFAQDMRHTTAHLYRAASLIREVNKEPDIVQSMVREGTQYLLFTTNLYYGKEGSYEDLKRSVDNARLTNRQAAEEMTTSFGRLNLVQMAVPDDPFLFHRSMVKMSMASTRVAAQGIEKVGEGVKWVAEKTLGEETCKDIAAFSRRVVVAGLDAVGLKEPVKKFLRLISTPPDVLIELLQTGCDASKEMAEERAMQYMRDIQVVTLAAVPIPFAGKVAGKAYKMPKAPAQVFEAEWHEVAAGALTHQKKLPAPSTPVKQGPIPVELEQTFTLAAERQARELSLVREHVRDVQPTTLPLGLPRDLKEFYLTESREAWPITPNPFGIELPFKVSFITTRSGDGLFLFEEAAFTSKGQRFFEAGNEGVLQSTLSDELGMLLKDISYEGSRLGINRRLFTLHDPKKMPLLSAVQTHPVPVLGVGSYVDPLRQTTLTLLEVGLKKAEVQARSSPLSWPAPMELFHKIDREVRTKTSPNYNIAAEGVAVDQFLPPITFSGSQEELWSKMLLGASKQHGVKPTFTYLSEDPLRLMVKVRKNTESFIVKDYFSEEGVIDAFQGNMLLSQMRSPFIEFPQVVSVGHYTHDGQTRFVLVKTEVVGTTYRENFIKIGSLPFGSPERTQCLEALAASSQQLGKGAADIHTKYSQRNRINPERNIKEFQGMREEVHDQLFDMGMGHLIDFEQFSGSITAICEGYKQAPGRASISIGTDISGGQFVLTQKGVGFIDTETVTCTIGTAKQGIQPLGELYHKINYMFVAEGIEYGHTFAEIARLQQAFKAGYDLPTHDSAFRFCDLYYHVDAIRSVAEGIELGKPIPHVAFKKLVDDLKRKLVQ